MKLSEKQRTFAKMVPRLIDKAHELGFEVTLGDCHRDKRCSYGSKTSKHKTRQAIDLNLFLNGKYLRKTEDHMKLGEWWESVGGVWGGRFNDGNHYQANASGQYMPDVSTGEGTTVYSVTLNSVAPIIISEGTS